MSARTTEKAAWCSSLNLLVLVRFFERYGGMQSPSALSYRSFSTRLNHAHPCEMSDHLDSGLSAYTDNGCGHVFLRVSRLRRRTLTWRGLARFPPIPCSVGVPSGWSPKCSRVRALFSLMPIISLLLQLRARLHTCKPPCSWLPHIFFRLLQNSDPSRGYPDGPASGKDPHTPSCCPAHM